MTGIELHIKNVGFSVSMTDVVSLITGDGLRWRILYYYGYGCNVEELDLADYEDKIIKSSNGLPITWDEIKLLASSVRQTIDCLIVGDRDESKLIRYSSDRKMYAQCELVLHLIDGGIWEIHAKDASVIEGIYKHFEKNPDVKIQLV